MATTTEETGQLESTRGIRLPFTWRPVEGSPLALVFVMGFGEHQGRYEHVAEALAGRGYASLRFDYRGHGRADGRRAYINVFDEYLDDVDAAVGAATERGEGRPVVLVGHSQGGLISAVYAQRRGASIARLALSNPFFALGFKPPAWKEKLGTFASSLWPTLAMPAGLDTSKLSHDAAVVKDYDADPLVLKNVTARWFGEITATQKRAVADAGEVRVPTLLMLGTGDVITDPGTSRAFFERLGTTERELIEYPGLYHELFNEPEKARVFDDLAAWLAKE